MVYVLIDFCFLSFDCRYSVFLPSFLDDFGFERGFVRVLLYEPVMTMFIATGFSLYPFRALDLAEWMIAPLGSLGDVDLPNGVNLG